MDKKELQEKAKELYEYFEGCDDGYYENKRMFKVNVKRYNDNVDMDELIATYPRRYQKALREEFTEEGVSGYPSIYSQWIEDAQEMLIEDIKSNSEYGNKEDKQRMRAFGRVHDGTVGFYGRSGGHFCFEVDNSYEDLLPVIKWEGTGYEDCYDMTTKYARNIIAEALELQEDVDYIKNYVKKGNDAMDFENELKYRIEEYIGELKYEEKAQRKEKKDIAQKAKAESVKAITVSECLNHKKEVIRRNASSIIQEL